MAEGRGRVRPVIAELLNLASTRAPVSILGRHKGMSARDERSCTGKTLQSAEGALGIRFLLHKVAHRAAQAALGGPAKDVGVVLSHADRGVEIAACAVAQSGSFGVAAPLVASDRVQEAPVTA